MKKVKNELRVYHYPQVPCDPFYVDVKDEEEAYKIMNVLADQHLFLYQNKFIADYTNAIYVSMWDEGAYDEGGEGWTDYWNKEEKMEFDEFVKAYLIKEV